MLNHINLDVDFLKKIMLTDVATFMSWVKFIGIMCAYGAPKTHMLLGSTYGIVRK
jgi:hypothetical protein